MGQQSILWVGIQEPIDFNKMSHPQWLNWHICHKRKLLFLFVFSTYLPMFLLKFWANLIPHPTSTHTAYFWRTLLTPKKEILENMWWWKNVMMIIITFFQVFLTFGIAGSVKNLQCGYSLDVELNSTSNELFYFKFE